MADKKTNKRANPEKERYSLTAKACFAIAISDTRISPTDVFFEDAENHTFQSAYIILERRMNEAGYITDKDGKTKDNKDSEEPKVIFSRTIKGFYPNASDEQIDAAWELFVYHMTRQGDATNRKSEKETSNKS